MSSNEVRTCRSCVAHVDEALTEVQGVAAVEVKMEDGRVIVRHDAANAPVLALIDALRMVGYDAEPVAA